jgi:hypothetical protein
VFDRNRNLSAVGPFVHAGLFWIPAPGGASPLLLTISSAKGADARRQTLKELARSLGGALDIAPVLRVFLKDCTRDSSCRGYIVLGRI